MPQRQMPHPNHTRAPSVRTLLLWPSLLLATVGLLIIVVWAGLWIQRLFISQAEQELEIEAFLVANALRDPLANFLEGESPRGRPLGNLVLSYAADTGARIVVALPDGRIVFSSEADMPFDRLPMTIELQAALAQSEQHDIRPDDLGSGELRLYAAAPIVGEDGMIGLVQLSVPYAPIQQQVVSVWLRTGAIAALVVGMLALALLWLARVLNAPLEALTTVAETMAEGHLDVPISPKGPAEVQRLALAFATMAARIREMLVQQQQFAAHAAHELRSPLTSMRLRLEMIERLVQSGDEMRLQRYLQETETELQQLETLVSDLLSLASIEHETDAVQKPVDLAPLLYAVADELHPELRTRGVQIEMNVPPHLPLVVGHSSHLRIAVRNLLDNAIKYGHDGGRIALRAYATPTSVVVEIQDWGKGIEPADLPHLFDRFYRSKAVRGMNIRGTGLGLAMVKAIVERHRGAIEVESEPGKGTTFRLMFPIASDSVLSMPE
nr:HAMP domain-containing sensor histidine kinase [Ardenticatena sp.]